MNDINTDLYFSSSDSTAGANRQQQQQQQFGEAIVHYTLELKENAYCGRRAASRDVIVAKVLELQYAIVRMKKRK